MITQRLILCSFVIICFTTSNGQNNFFLANKYSNANYFCVTNSSFALSWIIEEVNDKLDHASSYIPKPNKNNFDCDIKNDAKTKSFARDPWSLLLNYNEIVLDERWEELPVLKTEFVDGVKIPLIYTPGLTIPSSATFSIPLSIRIEREGHIFLCDGKNPSESNCYWFMLQAFSGTGSAIRKCRSGFIPSVDRVYPKDPCSNRRDFKNHTVVPKYVSNKKWSHFILSKRGNFFTFTEVDGYKSNKILEFEDKYNPISVTDMIIHSKMVNGLWKIHSIDFIFTQDERHEVELGPLIYPQGDSVCISMYISMCSTCKIKLTLAADKTVINEMTYSSEHAGWSMIKFITDKNIQHPNGLKLLVSTIGSSQHRFWSIDKVRLCQKEEFRYLGLSAEAGCQLMSNAADVIYLKDEPTDSPSITNNKCPEDTIGEFCVKCNWIYDNCKQITTCTDNTCRCSAGYQGKNCYYKCSAGYYGHGCQKPCGKCSYYYCNHVDGTCSNGCNDNYSGPKCDIPPSIIFTNPPEINDITYSEAIIFISNFNIDNGLGGEQPQHYTIQYKKAEDSTNWTTHNQKYEFNKRENIRIVNLEPETLYFVRGVVILENDVYQIGDHLKSANFTTKCQEIPDENINFVASNTSVFISLLQPTSITCKSYTISLFEDKKPGYLNGSGVYFDILEPFKEYTIIVQSNFQRHEKKFMTTEGVPTQIRSLQTNLSSSAMELKWIEPQSINGNFKHYVVEYQHLYYLACGTPSPNPSKKIRRQVTNTAITINDLIPYSSYGFSVFAANTKYEGLPYSHQEYTPASATIEPEETPKIFNITPGHMGANVELSKPHCEKIRGPLTVKMTTTCTSEWCIQQNRQPKVEDRDLPDKLIILDKLTPFSDYNIDLKFCRPGGSCDVLEKKQFKTEPTVPGKISNLLVYTRNESSISLRWQPPYPPTGILKQYKINYYFFKNAIRTDKEIIIEVTACKLWSQLHCATLSEIRDNTYTTFKVSARNEDPPVYGDFEQGGATTRTDKSRPPYDIRINWTKQNDLKLEWKHPNETNGNVKYFGIDITTTGSTIKKQLPVSEDTYNLTYYYKVNATELSPTTTYDIKIFAHNGQHGLEESRTTTSPPDIPTLLNEAQFDSSNDTITVTVSFNELRGSTDEYDLLVLRTDKQSNLGSYKELQKYDLKDLRVVLRCDIKGMSEAFDIILGDNQQSQRCQQDENFPLEPATSYNVTIILINRFKKQSRDKVYSFIHQTQGERPPGVGNSSLFGLFALLLVIPLAAILYKKKDELISAKNNFFQRNNTSTEVLEIHEDQIALSHVAEPKSNIQEAKKNIKLQPKPSSDATTAKVYSKPIKITEFEEYVKDSIKNGELERQHALFPRGQTKPWTCGSLKENKSKNRYNNLIAYDHTRVILQKIDGNPHSDYVNANYIDGHKVQKAYIATQGPKAATLNDFWRMIWQENVKHIANLANIYEGGKKKLEKYWPDINETLQFGDITVQYLSHNVYADYEYRLFSVTHNEGTRKVDQLHFSSWPDHGVPLYSQSLVPFLQRILQIPLTSKSPIVVHCSAGVGRTGTILLCDICLRMAAREGTIDVLRNVQLLRDQRANMVDNIEQYKLAHLVVLECLVGLHTSIPCNEIDESVQKLLENGSMTVQMRYLKDTQWQDQAMKTVGQTGEQAVVVREKNRFEHILPEIQGRVFISRFPLEDDTSSYINAVKVDGFRCPGRYIVTQQPMPNTLSDFWRLIDENSTTNSVIISLNAVNAKDRTCCQFWPTTSQPQMTPHPHISLKHINTRSLECYDVTTVHLSGNSRKDVLPVQILSMKRWAPKVNCPPSVEEFLTFWEESDSTARGSSPVFVTCYDGAKASGVYVAMSFIIEKMKLEQICNVCQAVRTVRHNRQQFVQDLEQFEFLYKAAVLYINGFESYANFSY